MQLPNTTAVWADFCHISTVRGRKVCILTLEAPLEDMLEVLKRLGNPVGADSIPVAIAPIDTKKVAEHLDVRREAPSDPKENGSSKKPFHELPFSQQAALRCGDQAFQEFVKANDEAQAKLYVTNYCGVVSRSEIKPDTSAGDYWYQLEARYQAWLTDRKFAEAKR